MKVCISSPLSAPPRLVWDVLQRIDTLRHVASGLLRFTPTDADDPLWQHAEWQVGETYQMRLWLLNVFPVWEHHLTVASLDHAAHRSGSREHGGFITQWNHAIWLIPLPEGGTLYTDEIDIDAGWLTVPVGVFAWIFYQYRQWRWRKFARSLPQS